MQAVIQDTYGPPERLEVRTIETPRISDDEVLVRVEAAGLHIGDSFGVRGAPLPMRLVSGLLRPKYGVPGFDVAGRVETVGASVTKFNPGDEVFGVTSGACAEYAAVAEGKLAQKPKGLSFEQAAALPTSALAALQGLRDVAHVRPGDKVLINGASGGVGTMATQIAKSLGAHVTAVCGARSAAMVRSIGADRVIDYATQDFTLGGPQYDVIFDNVENRSLAECRRALTPRGTLVLNSGTGARGLTMLLRLVHPLALSPFVGQSLRRFVSNPNHADLVILGGLADAGTLRPVIDSTFPLHATAAALRYIESGHARGKVVIAV
ncbi:MAG: NAD(P)-dependent alcohol dehydrogenase [Chloroflexi bacterium]|nr:NAD(P)-dependent alcohol dehydrogenase [Chloroflexota bacterium]